MLKSKYHRYSDWAETESFSLNAVESAWTESAPFNTETISITPVLNEFQCSGIDPSGSRHLTSHATYLRCVASGTAAASLTYPALDYYSANLGTSSGITPTRCLVFRIDNFELATSRIHDIKLWSSDLSDFIFPQYSKVVWETAEQWTQNKSLPVNHLLDSTKWLPDSLPDAQNLYRQNGPRTIFNTNDDHVSEYIYLAVACSGTTPLGEYGSTTQVGGFKLRCTFSYDNITELRD
jgi:hypothetical protein